MDAGRSATAGPSRTSPKPPSPRINANHLSKRTSSRNALNTTHRYFDAVGSPPSTPSTPPPIRRRRQGKEPVNARTEHLRRGDSTIPEEHRHSHGLSWSSTTRDSVVDNLLLSLGNFSSQHMPMDGPADLDDVEFDKEKYRIPDMTLPGFPSIHPAHRPRGHTYSSSLSSGYDVKGTAPVGASPSSKYSNSTVGRRSNSSSNFPTIGGRPTAARKMNGRSSSDTQKRIGGAAHGKSASSDIETVEYGFSGIVEPNNNRPSWGGRRSMSMDQIYHEPSVTGRSSVLDRGRPVPSVHSKYEADFDPDAAPEPGVPAGPRKQLNPTATGPVYVNQAPSKQSIRKVNTQSDLRTANRASPPIPQYIQDQASDFVRNNSMRGMPSLPMPHDHRRPSASPGFKTSRKDAPSPHRERPGFFKRVFGGASRIPSGLSERSDSLETVGYFDRVVLPNRSTSQVLNDTPPPTRNDIRKASKDSGAIPNPPPALTKKPSSFFRRRKKSNTDNVPPPLPINSSLNLQVKAPEPSPSVSSLRKVMDPYLAKDANSSAHDAPRVQQGELPSRPTTRESRTGDSEDLDIFHSGYTPPPDASLRSRDPLRRDGPEPANAAEDTGSPRGKLKVKKRKPDAVVVAPTSQFPQQNRGASSFPHDASREVSTSTIGEQFVSSGELSKVSPLSETEPPLYGGNKENERPVSRASTGDRILASKVGPAERRAGLRTFSADMTVSTDATDDGWVVTYSPTAERPDSKKSDRLFLKPTDQEDAQRQDSTETLSPVEGPRQEMRNASLTLDTVNGSGRESIKSPATVTGASSFMQSTGTSSEYHSATSLPLPSLQVDGKPRVSMETHRAQASSSMPDEGAEYRERARKIYEGDEEDVTKSEASPWLGERNTLSTRTLQAYMQLFDFAGQNILSALRKLCGKLLLKGETQQFDRIITALSSRWCECNPNNGFKAQDVVHTICYSLILLNTDLHLADIGEKMSKSAYVKNTLPTIRRVLADAAPNAFDDTLKPSPNASRPSLPWQDASNSALVAVASPPETPNERTSFEFQRPAASKRLSVRPNIFRNESDGWAPDLAGGSAPNALVNQQWTGHMRGWEFEIETVLKSFFASIRTEPLPLLGAPIVSDLPSADRNLSIANFGGLKRSGSVVSKAPSDNLSYRSKPGFRTMTMGWQNRNNRSRPKLYPASTVASSRTSFDDNTSMWSPAQSSTWSKNSFAKTLTSTSMHSLGHHLSPSGADYKHSIGFANALSQAIIREEGAGTGADDSGSIPMAGSLLEDDSLALEGAPWAKEGLVKHKHHLEGPERKAKERNWVDCFAVIGKGKLTLFSFNTTSKSHTMGRRAPGKQLGGGRASSTTAKSVGGGDWMENAETLDSFVLRQTIASTLPRPGYSKARPHVWALSCPSGAVHLFQVGTPEIAQEFMTSANYWSARLSKEPLSGSVSNIEYGWSDQVINPALLDRPESFPSPPSSMQNKAVTSRHMHSSSGSMAANQSSGGTRPSFQSSLRGSFDAGFGVSARSRLPGDKVQVADWQPPTQSLMASQLMEVDQLKGLTAYVANAEEELERHNELKHAIELAYSPRHPNHNRAMQNWQHKSDYLLREIVKFRTYIDALTDAQKAKERFYAKKAELEVATLASSKGGSSKGGISPVDSGRMKEERDLNPRAPQSATSPAGSGRFREDLDGYGPRPPMTAG